MSLWQRLNPFETKPIDCQVKNPRISQYLACLDKGLIGTVVDRAWNSENERLLEITSTASLDKKK